MMRWWWFVVMLLLYIVFVSSMTSSAFMTLSIGHRLFNNNNQPNNTSARPRLPSIADLFRPYQPTTTMTTATTPRTTRISGSIAGTATPPSVGPIARTNTHHNEPIMPCCRDRFGSHACAALRKFQPDTFEKRCLNDHDFHTIDCCMECRNYIDTHKIHPENARNIFKAPYNCKDKHSVNFCRKFKRNGLGKYSCSDAEFAMRICRQSCGYCDDTLYAYNRATAPCKQLY